MGLGSGGPQVDLVARVVAITSLIVAVVSVGLTWYLWRRSGPEIIVLLKDNHGMEWTGRGRIAAVEVVNSGRMPAVIRDVQLHWTEPQAKIERFLIGKWPPDQPHECALDPPGGKWPVTIKPTGFMIAAFAGRDARESVDRQGLGSRDPGRRARLYLQEDHGCKRLMATAAVAP